MGRAVVDPDRERPAAIDGLPVLDRIETAGGAGLPDQRTPASAGLPAGLDGVLKLPFDARSRSRLRATLECGREVALVLPRGSVLRDGAIVSGAGLRVGVLAGDEDVLEVRADGPTALARAAYHLGNRHVPVQVAEDRLVLGYDPVLADMLIGLGTTLRRVWSPFEPESGAYASGH